MKDWERLAAPLRAAFCAGWGRPTDPVVYLKIFLVGYFENITYDTDLAERIEDSLAVRHFLGYTLLESTSDHSTSSETRARLAGCCEIAQVLEAAVAECLAQGLVSGEEARVDSTLLPANASLSSLKSLRTGKRVAGNVELVATPGEFLDVSSDYWAHDGIMACLAAGVVSGCEDGLYHPELQVTRDQMAVYISRALAEGDDRVPEFTGTPTFPDVGTDQWALKYVEYAVDQAVVGGFDDGTYRPEVVVTRDQMAVFVARCPGRPRR